MKTPSFDLVAYLLGGGVADHRPLGLVYHQGDNSHLLSGWVTVLHKWLPDPAVQRRAELLFLAGS